MKQILNYREIFFDWQIILARCTSLVQDLEKARHRNLCKLNILAFPCRKNRERFTRVASLNLKSFEAPDAATLVGFSISCACLNRGWNFSLSFVSLFSASPCLKRTCVYIACIFKSCSTAAPISTAAFRLLKVRRRFLVF